MKQVLSFLCFSIISVFADEKKPNIIFILADDLGWSDTELDEALRSLRQPYPEINSSSELASICTVFPRDKLEITCQQCFIYHERGFSIRVY